MKAIRNLKGILGLLIFLALISCGPPTTRTRPLAGDADHSGGIVNVGSDPYLAVPSNFRVLNNKTAQEKYLRLSWNAVPDATGYRLYRAVYSSIAETADPEPQEFKLLTELTQPYPMTSTITYDHQIPEVPLRRYAYYVTATRFYGESEFSEMIYGNRMPVDEVEALRDMDYSIHFAQCGVPNFGAFNLDELVIGRGGGRYEYASKVGRTVSNFYHYADFETQLHGQPKMTVTLSPMGAKMNGSITASGLYDAVLTYSDFQGVIGGLTVSGNIHIEYHHPTRGKLSKSLNAQEGRAFMKTVAFTVDEVFPMPPRREWDEADQGYVRMTTDTKRRQRH